MAVSFGEICAAPGSWLLVGLSTSCVIGAWMLTRASEIYRDLRLKVGRQSTGGVRLAR